MQVSNHGANQVLFAFNAWDEGDVDGLGIGNNGNGHPDWTFTRNAAQYPLKNIDRRPPLSQHVARAPSKRPGQFPVRGFFASA